MLFHAKSFEDVLTFLEGRKENAKGLNNCALQRRSDVAFAKGEYHAYSMAIDLVKALQHELQPKLDVYEAAVKNVSERSDPPASSTSPPVQPDRQVVFSIVVSGKPPTVVDMESITNSVLRGGKFVRR